MIAPTSAPPRQSIRALTTSSRPLRAQLSTVPPTRRRPISALSKQYRHITGGQLAQRRDRLYLLAHKVRMIGQRRRSRLPNSLGLSRRLRPPPLCVFLGVRASLQRAASHAPAARIHLTGAHHQQRNSRQYSLSSRRRTPCFVGGEGEIRTHETCEGLPVFKSDHPHGKTDPALQ
jgi:hypothetical protein